MTPGPIAQVFYLICCLFKKKFNQKALYLLVFSLQNMQIAVEKFTS